MAKRQPPVRSARRRRGAGRQPHRQRRAAGGVPAAGERAHAHLQRRREVRRRAAPPLDGAPQARRRHRARRRAAALPAAGARDAGQRGVHQLRARGPAGGAEAQGGARRRRRHDLVRHGAARERRRLRPQDPAQHRALLVSSSRSSRPRPAPPRRLFPPRVELRDRPRAQHGRRRAVHPAGDASTTPTAATRRCPDKFKARALHAPARRRGDAGVRAAPAATAHAWRRAQP